MIETAVSVARNCGMVPLQDKVIVVDAYPPDQRHAARLEYNYAEIPSEVMSELSDEEVTHHINMCKQILHFCK